MATFQLRLSQRKESKNNNLLSLEETARKRRRRIRRRRLRQLSNNKCNQPLPLKRLRKL